MFLDRADQISSITNIFFGVLSNYLYYKISVLKFKNVIFI